MQLRYIVFVFFFNDTATTKIYTLSLHDALPISDTQSGYEKGYTVSLAAHSGANLIYESAGMHASLLGCCLESYVIDNDMLGAINRTVRGVEVNDETLSIDPIREVCLNGPGHYLGHEQT